MKNKYTHREWNTDQDQIETPAYLKSILLLFIIAMLSLTAVQAQVGEVLWEDNFDTLDEDLWTPLIGDGCDFGICGWGNQELQSYQADNAFIEGIPGEPGNNALVIEARRENVGGRSFTSARLTTDKKVAIHYGLIEVRLKVPDLESGLWPAAWLLGTTNLVWPAKGEIDMMEMGFNQEERTRQQEPNSTRNTYVGANAFFPIPDNGGVGNIAFDVDFNTPYVADQPLNERFVTYKLYWEPTQLRFVVEDNGVEYDLYAGPLPIDPEGDTAPFSRPFYMLLNMAVGGTLPGILDPNGVNAPLPGKMLVDYVRVSEYNGFGSVEFGDGGGDLVAESGNFGVFTENTPVANSLNFGADADIFVFSDTFSEGSEEPFEGDEVISWNFNAGSGFFGAGITSLFGKNMSNYAEEGTMKFKIKIPADVTFRIGITDNFTNEQYLTFPAGETKYGLVRNGEWGQVEIPLSEYEGLLAFQNLAYLFIFSSDGTNVPATSFPVAIDDIVWEDGSGVVGCQPTDIVASATVNGEQTSQTNLTVESGDSVSLNPAPAQGTWSWSGPNNFSSNQRQVDLGDVQEGNGGSYTATYTNDCGAESTVTYRITVDSITPPPPPPPSGDVVVTLFKDCPFSGSSAGLEVGSYTRADLESRGVLNNDVSSLRIAPGFKATLYLDDNFGGRSFEKTADVSCLTSDGFNDLLSSIVVSEIVDDGGNNNNGGCSQLSANGDYVAEITEDGDGTFLTFVPQEAGIGDQVAILYYGTDQNGTFPGFGIAPNTPVRIDASVGQTVYFYYTYSVPNGGERNTASDRQSLEVGSCAGSALAFKISPNPTQDRVSVEVSKSEAFHTARLLNGSGQEIDRTAVDNGRNASFNTASLPKGMYFVQMVGDSETSTKGLIKE